MKTAPRIPAETLARQALASDPANSAWVSANAGSGKTHVLAQRVIRLLLDGTEPARILCLTYTRAAAANMANRVFDTLAGWTTLPDAELAGRIAALEGRQPDRERLVRARRLFAEALETPGGLKIQTIHAFCEAVLQQFPLEANVAGHFELLDGQMEAALIAEVRRGMIAGAADGSQPALGEAFAQVLDRAGEAGLAALLSEIVRRRDALRAFIAEIGTGDERFEALYEAFGLRPGLQPAEILGDIWPDPYFDRARAQAISMRADAAGKARAGEFADALLAACGTQDPAHCLDLLRAAFLTRKPGGVWEARSTKQILAKGVAEHFPELAADFERFAGAIQAACDRMALLAMLDATRAALVVADWLVTRYERLKRARGFLDFNDLIVRTVALLSREDAGAWVQYKLDKGIDHILLDEAQDTSPDQWQVVRRLAEEFFAGQGAREVRRTVFAVGDEKQSIYSFQGARPETFAESGHEFAARVRAAERSFEHVRLTHSFRSTHDVLSAVDLVFSREETARGLTRDREAIEHAAIREDAPGHVELWPSLSPQIVEEPDDWTQAVDHASAPAARLAADIAETIRRWLANGEVIEGRGRRLRAGDVMVLVRKRDRFFHALSRELKNRDVPVAGADRLALADHIAVQDLTAIGRFVLQPDDDLSLAALLKSPVFGHDEDMLYELAAGRGRAASLYSVLRRRAQSDIRLAGTADRLARWRDEIGFSAPFEFYQRILGRDGVRADMIARLGHEAGDVLDEFLNFCLAAERTGIAGLEALLAMLDGGGPEVKREMDQMRGEVRIMTAHAAKGLEAPVVFLVDSGSAPFSDSHLPVLMPFDAPDGAWRGPGFFWRSGAATSNALSRQVAAAAREKAEEEYRRLLYVGMTRAEDRLVVCGYQGKRAPSAATWHSIVKAALEETPLAREEPHPVTGEPILRYRSSTVPPVAPDESGEAGGAAVAPPPAALFAALPSPPPLPRPLSPSGAHLVVEAGPALDVARSSPVLDGQTEPGGALRRGTAVHRLLQLLPTIAPEAREAAASRFLTRFDWDETERDELWQGVRAVLEDDAHAALFALGSRTEVSIMGTVEIGGTQRAVSGKIDRLAVDDHGVLIVDYKTNRPAPRVLSEVPPAHLAQLALYRALLTPLYPDLPVRAALLYTDAPRLIDLPQDALDAALARLRHA